MQRVVDSVDALSGERSTTDRLERHRSTTMTPTTTTITTNAPAQPSSIATKVSPPLPPLTATTGDSEEDLVDGRTGVRHTFAPLSCSDFPVSPEKVHTKYTETISLTRRPSQAVAYLGVQKGTITLSSLPPVLSPPLSLNLGVNPLKSR